MNYFDFNDESVENFLEKMNFDIQNKTEKYCFFYKENKLKSFTNQGFELIYYSILVLDV